MARGRHLRAAALAALLSAGLPGAAAAQEPGRGYDPDSPAGKEYAIPLEDARSDAAGGYGGGGAGPRATRGAGAPDDAGAPLFGEGVERAAGSGEGGASGGGQKDGGRQGDGGDGGDGGPSSSSSSSPDRGAPEVRRSSVPPGDSAEPTATLIGIGAIGLGVLVGFLARRRRVSGTPA